MKRMKLVVLAVAMTVVGGLFLIGCGSTPPPDLIGVTSYYVRADGNDRNAGTSEDAPFRTLGRALVAASRSTVKKITVIGTLVGEMTVAEAERIDPQPIIELSKMIDGTGDNLVQALTNQMGVAYPAVNFNTPNPHEILITGKPDASDAERAVLTSETGMVLLVINKAVRLEYIEISGCQVVGNPAVFVGSGNLTMAQGAKITNNKSPGIYVMRSLLIMRDNAEVSYIEGRDNVGIYLDNGSVGMMLDNSLVAYNIAENNGGGIALNGSSLTMRDNASVSNNTAGNVGGGIITYTDSENRFISQVWLQENASVNQNSARFGGGVFLNPGDRLLAQDAVRITENTATREGGGIFGAGDATVRIEGDALLGLTNNNAPQFPDSNFTFN